MSEFEDAIRCHHEDIDEKVRRMRLLLLDRETGEERYCTLDEAETWDWANPEFWRIVNGWQITSFDGLLNILSMKAEKGIEEIQILQAPRFMMLSGG
ncbi:MAG: hypothetical protein ABSD38_25070 [Syntrophorhabdales bacterium]|jgi:hypothetical protein